MTAGAQTTLRGLMELNGAVIVPLIQRDYAQGRADEQEVRDEFIGALANALALPADDPTLPLNLDFVYGNADGGELRAFQPLDGQQRLTTLFLLHWYGAWLDGAWDEFVSHFRHAEGGSRFSYQVRASSTEFFDAFVDFRPSCAPNAVESIAALITDQHWYFRSWRLDPSVQSTLVMLDALHSKFRHQGGLFARLVDRESPAVTFQLLDLKHFGLSDDLYIKMNARGKPLTQFETFKARYELELRSKFPDYRFAMEDQSLAAADYISRRMDTAWADLFWSLRDKKSSASDFAFMNVMRAFALISRDPDDGEFSNDIHALRSTPPTFADFHAKGWLDLPFTKTLARVLDQWCRSGGGLHRMLRTTAHFDEQNGFERIAKLGSSLQYTDIVQLAAYTGFITAHAAFDALQFEQWMRVVANLSVNTYYNRIEDLRRSISALKGLLPHALGIESFLAQPKPDLSGFSEHQISEEKLKAALFLADPSWRPLIERAEAHPYFRGQIEFLLSFSGAADAAKGDPPAEWSADTHKRLQARYLHFLEVAEQMFGTNGFKPLPRALWERALLCEGDYLMPSGRNMSLLTNAVTEEGSWKRFLRGATRDAAEKRRLLRTLWTRLDPSMPLESQLDSLISTSSVSDAWRASLVAQPEAITICEERCIRVQDGRHYLLKRTQLNGAHAELFSYCDYLRNRSRSDPLKHLRLAYFFTTDSYNEPFIKITLVLGEWTLSLHASFRYGKYEVKGTLAELQQASGLVDALGRIGIAAADAHVHGIVSAENLDGWLELLDNEVGTISESTDPEQ